MDVGAQQRVVERKGINEALVNCRVEGMPKRKLEITKEPMSGTSEPLGRDKGTLGQCFEISTQLVNDKLAHVPG
ncbi:hypothetical protein H0H92_012388 [Tricholoma furcatifolium]|nr:hypothetical protein H0H92_012388 [Tricholoma furcatifolium]